MLNELPTRDQMMQVSIMLDRWHDGWEDNDGVYHAPINESAKYPTAYDYICSEWDIHFTPYTNLLRTKIK